MGSLTYKKPLEVVATDFTVLEPGSNQIEKHWFVHFGIPLRLHIDQGRCFEGEVETNHGHVDDCIRSLLEVKRSIPSCYFNH